MREDARSSDGEPKRPFWLVPARERERRAGLGPTVIVEAAHRLIHEGGVEALGMRALAREVGAGTTAVYWYVKRKRYLLLAVAESVLAEVDIPPEPGRWRSRLSDLSHSVRKVLLAHPHVHAILSDQVIFTPATLTIAEACLEILAAAGFGDDERVHAYNAWAGHVIGFSIVEMKPALGSAQEEFADHVRRHLGSLDAVRYPNLVELEHRLANRAYATRWEPVPLGDGASFEYGLEALLDGLAVRATRGAAHRDRP